MGKETLEDIILRHSGRGMNLLRPYLPEDYCRRAAEALLALPKGNILLFTGFYVRGFAETDGPAGIYTVAKALRQIDFTPVIVTDTYLKGVFEAYGFKTVYFPFEGTDAEAEEVLERYAPTALFSLERCGRNSEGHYANMRGVSIDAYTAPVDKLFLLAQGKIPTFGVGDGGNEIGMGTLRPIIEKELSLVPCVIPADYTVIATVSNWGGYGIAAEMERLTGKNMLLSVEEILSFMENAKQIAGCIDGVSHRKTCTEDALPFSVTQEILLALRKYVSSEEE